MRKEKTNKMKAIGTFIIVLFILCVCFLKCTSDRTKIAVYNSADSFLKQEISKCNERIEAEKQDSLMDKEERIVTQI